MKTQLLILAAALTISSFSGKVRPVVAGDRPVVGAIRPVVVVECSGGIGSDSGYAVCVARGDGGHSVGRMRGDAGGGRWDARDGRKDGGQGFRSIVESDGRVVYGDRGHSDGRMRGDAGGGRWDARDRNEVSRMVGGIAGSEVIGTGGDSSRAFAFLDSVFNRPECSFLTAEPDIPADLQSVLIRFNNAISANRQWFLQIKEANAGQMPLPYDEHFGITRAEYARVQHMEQFPPRMIVLDSQRVSLHRQQDHILLEGDSSAKILNYLEFYTKAKKLIFAGDTLNFVGEMDAPPSSPFGQWHGFVWRLERTDVQATLQTNQITARVIEVDCGLPARADGRVFLRIKYQDVQQGVDRADMDLTGYIR